MGTKRKEIWVEPWIPLKIPVSGLGLHVLRIEQFQNHLSSLGLRVRIRVIGTKTCPESRITVRIFWAPCSPAQFAPSKGAPSFGTKRLSSHRDFRPNALPAILPGHSAARFDLLGGAPLRNKVSSPASRSQSEDDLWF